MQKCKKQDLNVIRRDCRGPNAIKCKPRGLYAMQMQSQGLRYNENENLGVQMQCRCKAKGLDAIILKNRESNAMHKNKMNAVNGPGCK